MDEREMGRLLDGVVGFLHPDEAVALHDAVLRLDRGHARVVELGACMGRSAIAMATALRRRTAGELHSVDLFGGDNLEVYERNLAERGLGDLVTTWKGYTHDVRQRWDIGTVRLLFIDASHEYADVVQDIDDWQPLLEDGATVIFNDASQPGVYRALTERVLGKTSPYRLESIVRSTLFTRYRPGQPPDDVAERVARRVARVLAMRRAVHPLVHSMPGPVKTLGNRLSGRLMRGRG